MFRGCNGPPVAVAKIKSSSFHPGADEESVLGLTQPVTTQGRYRLGLQPDHPAPVRRLRLREVDAIRRNDNSLNDGQPAGANIEMRPAQPKSLTAP